MILLIAAAAAASPIPDPTRIAEPTIANLVDRSKGLAEQAARIQTAIDLINAGHAKEALPFLTGAMAVVELYSKDFLRWSKP